MGSIRNRRFPNKESTITYGKHTQKAKISKLVSISRIQNISKNRITIKLAEERQVVRSKVVPKIMGVRNTVPAVVLIKSENLDGGIKTSILFMFLIN